MRNKTKLQISILKLKSLQEYHKELNDEELKKNFSSRMVGEWNHPDKYIDKNSFTNIKEVESI